ncbi:putative molybdenum cofactor biosynthesis protein [Paraphaeosphaeria sporulosa]|uniref:molybdopterin adenylyltransferase n=1 Tax=Paraphaeosphaeria sporulosa TaxID=1460663 RepID=A0A177CE08_9PLEO|nr:putative molybdenum cofactor biosynthesis protein [Paraphaeosphaeria sporulosa]OAG05863.1 putative molybdenum cofactor biosynthesis protein [Paraphaeosphaeria sporulosa]
MAIRYSEALGIIKSVAEDKLGQEDGRDVDVVPLEDAVGRTAGEDHVSPVATPLFDASTVDGYAISSAATANATKKRPVTFIVRGAITTEEELRNGMPSSGGGIPSCFEIKTGARFPTTTTIHSLDACVRAEDVVTTAFGGQKMITVVEPIPKNANKRSAGSDIQNGERLLEKGEKIQARHIMALASAGITGVAVRRALRIAIWSNTDLQITGASVYFLIAAFRELGAYVDFKGVLEGSTDTLSKTVLQQNGNAAYDAVITTGGVSMDLKLALKTLNARIRFDDVAIEPGRSVLFATLPTPYISPLVALPGSPVATAACFRFLLVPFAMQLSGDRQSVPKILKMQAKHDCRNLSVSCPPHSDCFKHGWIQRNNRGEEYVQLGSDQKPAKVSHFAASDCWVHVPRGHTGSYKDTLVYCYPHTSGSSM